MNCDNFVKVHYFPFLIIFNIFLLKKSYFEIRIRLTKQMEVIIMQNAVPDAPYIIEMSRDTPSRPHPIVDEESDEENDSCD